MSEHESDQIANFSGMGDVSSSVDSPKLAPDQELSAPPPDDIKPEAPRAEAPRIEPGVDAPKAETPRETGKIMIMAPSRDKSWDGATIDHGPAATGNAQGSGRFGKRLSAIAAAAVLAAIAGAIGGSLATSGSGFGVASEPPAAAASHAQAMDATIKRLESELAALKTGIDHSARGDAGRFAKVNDRLDKVEKANAESAAKLAKLNETQDKQRVAAAPAAAAVVAKDATGSIPAAAAAPVPLPAPKPDIARLPTVEGWVLRHAANGGALIEGRSGIYEVYAGDPVPGLGRVDAIRKQDGRWVVVTSRGLVVAR